MRSSSKRHRDIFTTKTDNEKRYRRALNISSSNNRNFLMLFVFFVIYLQFTSLSLNDTVIFNYQNISLPILNIDIPLNIYLISTPIFLIISHYIIFHNLYIHNNKIKSWQQNYSKRDYLSNLYPFIVNFTNISYKKYKYGLIVQPLLLIMLYFLPVSLLIFIEYKILPTHNYILIKYYQIVIFLDLMLITAYLKVFWDIQKRGIETLTKLLFHIVVVLSIFIFTVAVFGNKIDIFEDSVKRDIVLQNSFISQRLFDDSTEMFLDSKDIRLSKFKRVEFINRDFKNANLDGTLFINSHFIDSNLDGASFKKAIFIDSTFTNCSIDGVDFRDVEFSSTTFDYSKYNSIFVDVKYLELLSKNRIIKEDKIEEESLEVKEIKNNIESEVEDSAIVKNDISSDLTKEKEAIEQKAIESIDKIIESNKNIELTINRDDSKIDKDDIKKIVQDEIDSFKTKEKLYEASNNSEYANEINWKYIEDLANEKLYGMTKKVFFDNFDEFKESYNK